MNHNFTNSDKKLSLIKSTKFGIFSTDEIRDLSVVKIEYTDLYDNFAKGIIKQGGLHDPRLGCANENTRCYTCEGNIMDCPGHFGHIVIIFIYFYTKQKLGS